jgi:hypothetical protein
MDGDMRAVRILGAALAGALGFCSVTGCDDSSCDGASCVSPDQPGLRYAVELVPPAGSGLVRQQLADLPSDADGRVELVFGEPAVLSGRVYVSGSTDSSTAAHISALLASDPVIPGRTLVFETDAAGGLPAGSPSYRLPVAPGSYNLQITPSSQALPPILTPVTASADRTLDLVLPAAAELVEVNGGVYDASGAGVPGMRVQILRDTQVVSTTGQTLATGGFSVVMPRLPGSYCVRADPGDSQLLLPTLEQPLLVEQQSPIVQPVLRMPAHAALESVQFQLWGRGASGQYQAVQGTQLSLTTVVTDPGSASATFTVTARTDAAGNLTVLLVPNLTYTILVETSPGSDFASQRLQQTIGGTQIYLELTPKTPVTGRVLGANGKPVVGAVVQAVGQSSSASLAPLGQPAGDASVQTDAAGRFRLAVDPGVYDLEVTPADGSSYPRWAAESVGVAGGEVTLDIQLPPASRIDGQVVAPDGTPAADVDVRVYLITQSGFARLRGQARSGDDGSFTMILASPRSP